MDRKTFSKFVEYLINSSFDKPAFILPVITFICIIFVVLGGNALPLLNRVMIGSSLGVFISCIIIFEKINIEIWKRRLLGGITGLLCGLIVGVLAGWSYTFIICAIIIGIVLGVVGRGWLLFIQP